VALEAIHLRDRSLKLVRAWEEVFSQFDEVDPAQEDFFDREADAMVSPANAFGIMDGGLDAAIRDHLGHHVQRRVQEMILSKYHGEMPVGVAEVVATDHDRWPYLVVAPTMRVPENVANTLNAYLAFRACLLAVRRFRGESSGPAIRSMLVPGLGTGVGGMEPRKCAAQMRVAYTLASKPARIPSFDEIHKVHRSLRTAM
jgi:O-acetyl-ADP-ribose deacetylase (regulator of RNase III)